MLISALSQICIFTDAVYADAKKGKNLKAKKAKKDKPVDYPTVEYQIVDKGDPFCSPLDILEMGLPSSNVGKVALPRMNLHGFTWGYEPRAIINDQVVRKGDSISGAEVLEIKKEGVILIYQGKVFTVKAKEKQE